MAEEVPETPSEPQPPDTPGIPRWVPVLIGVVLVLIAALAVWTGLRYRNPTLANGIIKSRRAPRPMSGTGPPGEPEPGSSLIYPGATPAASAPVPGHARTEISGGGTQGISATTRLWARRGMTVHAKPEDAMVYVNETPIGQANQLTSVYEFAQPGSYNVRIAAPGYRDYTVVVTAADGASDEVANVTAKLERAQ